MHIDIIKNETKKVIIFFIDEYFNKKKKQVPNNKNRATNPKNIIKIDLFLIILFNCINNP